MTQPHDLRSPARTLLLKLMQQGLAAVNGRNCVHAALRALELPEKIYLVAIGKAADAMAAGAIDALGSRLRAGLVITRYGYQDSPVYRDPRLLSLEAGHPVPDEQSLAAGRALCLFLERVPTDARFVFLISGGTSSLAEVLPDDISLEQLQALNRWLLGSGLAIDVVNRIRSAVSSIKGGRLLTRLAGRRADVLLVSDVPGDDPAQVGSGLLMPADSRPLPSLPTEFAGLSLLAPEPQKAHENVSVSIVASNRQMLDAVSQAAKLAQVSIQMHPALPAADAIVCGEKVADILCAAAPGLHVWGGETVVTLPATPGRGGRNQALALAAARRMQGQGGCFVLSVGTDGSDGNTDDAGALVDGDSITRGTDAGLDVDTCLRNADSGTFLEASGDLLHTGPTGTNVMDLIIAYRYAD
ncbi:MAG: glycerate kinase type-2 family protein [Gammaproteobacteria bacterium]